MTKLARSHRLWSGTFALAGVVGVLSFLLWRAGDRSQENLGPPHSPTSPRSAVPHGLTPSATPESTFSVVRSSDATNMGGISHLDVAAPIADSVRHAQLSQTGRENVSGFRVNAANCLQARALGELAFVASSKSDFSMRSVALFGNAPGLRKKYSELFDHLGDSLANSRWVFLESLDPEGNETLDSSLLVDGMRIQSEAIRSITPEDLIRLFPASVGDQLAATRLASAWLDEALLGNFYVKGEKQ